MKKNFTSIAFALCLSLSAAAQTTTIRVQGAPRKVSTSVAARIQKAETTTTGIDFDKIQRWTGTGDCRAALAIKWSIDQNDDKTLVWGYRWNKGETKTGEDLIRAVLKADPALYAMGANESWGLYLGGFGYDADGDHYVTITTMTDEVYPRNGICFLPSSEFSTAAGTKWGDGDSWNTGAADFSTFWNYLTAENAGESLVPSQVGASGRILTDGCVDAYLFLDDTNTYDGNLEYLPATTDYTQGTFIVNEDWGGHNNGSVNFLGYDGTWEYNHLSNLGTTSCYGTFFGNRYYVVSKQAGHGGRLTICDANTTRIIGKIDDIGGDGRSFCGINEHKAYVSTSAGISIIDLDNMKYTGSIEGITAQCGNMVRLGDYVYAIAQNKGIVVINAETDKVATTISCTDCGSIVMAKDGSLWVSTTSGISKLNTENNTLESIVLSNGVKAPAQSWYAWTPDGLCASLQHNVLYWTAKNGDSSWSPLALVYKYDITTGETSLVVDLSSDAEGRTIYGCSFRVDPKTDNLYLSAAVGYTNNYKVRQYDADGKQLNEYVMNDEAKNYWFPGMFTFPDTEDPVVGNIDDVTLDEGKTADLDLTSYATDADNFQAAIVKTVEKVGDEKVATATVQNGVLVVNGVKAGKTTVTVKFCSNGISTTKDINVVVNDPTSINGTVNTADVHEVARYTADGKRIQQPQQGLNIVKFSDGSVKKVVVK